MLILTRRFGEESQASDYSPTRRVRISIALFLADSIDANWC